MFIDIITVALLAGSPLAMVESNSFQPEFVKLIREKVRQAKVDTHRKEFDHYLYLKANTPTLEEQRQQEHREELRRSLNHPPLTEVWSGKALNDLLGHLQKLQASQLKSPHVPLDAALLKQINVTTGKGGGGMAVLKHGGKLDWPVGLQTLMPAADTRALRQQIEMLYRQVVKQASTGRANAQALQQLTRQVDRLEQMLLAQVGSLSVSQYIEAKRFLGDLHDAVKVLERSDARNYFNGKYAAKGYSVDDLIRHMTKEGLRFAPATAGEESAYTSLHRALISYDLGADHGGLKH